MVALAQPLYTEMFDSFALSLVPEIEDESASGSNEYEKFISHPSVYARTVLGVRWWKKQREVANALLHHKRVMVRASHSVGKTHVSGGIVNWWYDIASPSICLTTAPTDRQVTDLLWKEVRSQRRGRARRGDLMPKAPRMESAEDHYAVGFTARDTNAFQGTHEERLLIIFDEAVGVDEAFWTGADAMLTSGESNRFLAIYNPTDTASAAYAQELASDAHIIVISALDHPNIVAQLQGKPRPYPKAVDISWVHQRVAEWCTPIDAVDTTTDDLEWPPGSGVWYKPGPLFESRVMGRWPSQAVGSVWSEAAFMAACEANLPEPDDLPCEIGCDVARFGDDETVIHVRRGPVSLWHETHNGWDTVRTASRLKELAGEYGQRCDVDGRTIALKVDDDGIGGGVTDILRADAYGVRPVGAGTEAIDAEKYPNRRSELWFVVAERARDRKVDFSRLPQSVRLQLRREFMSPTWKVDSRGRRVVEPKDTTKKRLGRSPDNADAVNLAFAFAPPPASASSDSRSVMDAYRTDRRSLSRLGMR